MRLSRACEVALRAMPLLPAAETEGRGVGLAELVAATGLPRPFLGKVMKELVKKGLLRSRRGRAGGYVLGRPASEITLADVVLAVERRESLERVYPAAGGTVGKALEPLRQRFFTLLQDRTVADLSAK